MDTLKPKPELESSIQHRIKKDLENRGWLVFVTHGNEYQRGFPDLYALHRTHGQRWIEVKRPQGFRLTPSQMINFPFFSTIGGGVWIMTGPEDYNVLFEHPNWTRFVK